MKKEDLNQFLYDQIPMIRSLGARVLHSDLHSIEVFAPLNLNKNHLSTAFGGSLGAVLITSCYGWLFQQLDEHGLHGHVVIKTAHTDYLAPVESDFIAVCNSPEEHSYTSFLSQLKRKGKARIDLEAKIFQGLREACVFKGEFVALKSDKTEIG